MEARGKGGTNNVAEWAALLYGLQAAAARRPERLLIHGDSQLAINQLTGRWRVHAVHLRPYRDRCLELLDRIGCGWQARWVPREENEEADGLSVQAYVEYEEAKRRARIKGVLPRLEKLETGKYLVHGSQTTYLVDPDAGTCTCPDFEKRHSKRFPIRCKHILAALEAEEEAAQ